MIDEFFVHETARVYAIKYRTYKNDYKRRRFQRMKFTHALFCAFCVLSVKMVMSFEIRLYSGHNYTGTMKLYNIWYQECVPIKFDNGETTRFLFFSIFLYIMLRLSFDF